jgi:prolyl-tRNA synthetase
MRASTLHIVTYRDDPADAEIASHRLLARAGYIHKVGSGLYVYGPLLWRVLSKVQRILREELDAVGAVEIQAPILQERALWERSGRWEVYQASGTLFTTTGRRGGEYALAPTAEEVFTEYVAATARSYKQLPLCLYQVHTKFRDELRPRFGLMRVREFLMKDAYSFDADEAGLDAWYERMRGAYERFFARLGVQAFGVEADSGEIGGSGSMEFMVAASAGEDAILMEPGGAYAANVEKATSRLAAPAAEAARALRAVSTPGVRTIAELEGFFPEVPAARMVKTLLYEVRFADRFEPWAVLIRGDCELNPVKLRGHLGALEVTPLAPEQVGRLTGASPGFVGPVGLPEGVRVVADDSVRGLCNVVCGMNRDDTHAVDVNLGRDFPEPRYAELRLARAGEPGPVTGAPLEEVRGVEVGHIFKLGTKYSEAMGATFIDRDGKARPYVMGWRRGGGWGASPGR